MVVVSIEDWKSFLDLFVQQFDACYTWLTSINIAGLSMFQWILGFIAAGTILTVIRAFAGVGGVSVTGVSSGVAEHVRAGQAEGRRAADRAERESKIAADRAERESYEHYAKTRERNAAYNKRYRSEHK